jgi:hypothetical protein
MFPYSTGSRVSLLCWFFLVPLLVIAAFTSTEPAFAQTATTTTLTVTSGSSAVTSVASGTVVTLTATVKAGTTAVTPGQVKFCDATATYCEDFHIVGTAQLTSTGTAVFKFRPASGSYSYKAVFVGTKTHKTSSSAASSLSVTGISPHPTATVISWSGLTSNPTLTGTVIDTGFSPGPTGTVSFVDTSNSNAVLGEATLGTPSSNVTAWTSATLTAGDNTEYYAVGDFNGDGIPDIAASINNTVTIFLGDGNGGFTPVANPATVNNPGQIVVADFNSDGIPDLAVLSGDDQIAILLGKGDGTFTAAPLASTGYSRALAVGDFNNDGIPDLVTIDFLGYNVNPAVLLGNGDGTFTLVHTYAAPYGLSGTYSVAVADFNGDGFLDIAFTDGAGTVYVFFGNGTGTFPYGSGTSVTIPGAYTHDIVEADFNGDGIPDLAVNGNSAATFVYLGTASGSFNQAPTVNQPADFSAIAVGDFNGDGIPDLAGTTGVYGPPYQVIVLPGNGDGTFSTPNNTQWPNETFSNGLVTADLNGNGLSNLITSVFTDSTDSPTALVAGLTGTQTSTASLSTNLSFGTHVLEASYSGDTNFQSSTSSTTTIVSTPPPAITSPAPGSHLSSSSVTFTWSPGTGVTEYLLNVGTEWPGSDDIYSSGQTAATSAVVTGLPTDGITVYVMLKYQVNNVWYASYYTYTAEGSTAPPVLTSPVPGSTLSGSTATFTWTPGSGVTGYSLAVGTLWAGSDNIYGSPVITSTSANVSGLPTNGATVYVMLRYQIGGVWNDLFYTYTAQ